MYKWQVSELDTWSALLAVAQKMTYNEKTRIIQARAMKTMCTQWQARREFIFSGR